MKYRIAWKVLAKPDSKSHGDWFYNRRVDCERECERLNAQYPTLHHWCEKKQEAIQMTRRFELLAGKIEKATDGSAAFDLFSIEDQIFEPGMTIGVRTGVLTKFDPQLVCIIKEKSGLALKHDFHVHGGVIDSDYDQEWKVIARWAPRYVWKGMNHIVQAGQKIAQFMIIELPVLELVGSGIRIVDSKRVGGFGSTGSVSQTTTIEARSPSGMGFLNTFNKVEAHRTGKVYEQSPYYNGTTKVCDSVLFEQDQRWLSDHGCKVPPAGWKCTREGGHSGPCAAVETTNGK